VAGCCEDSDEPLGSDAMELVSFTVGKSSIEPKGLILQNSKIYNANTSCL
jgi:hypothetical protein